MLSVALPPTDTIPVSETVVSGLSQTSWDSNSTSTEIVLGPVEVVHNKVSVFKITEGENSEQQKGGRKNRMTNKQKQNMQIAYKTALTKASCICSFVKKKCKVGMLIFLMGLLKIINETKQKLV
jgi:hypothetical protein